MTQAEAEAAAIVRAASFRAFAAHIREAGWLVTSGATEADWRATVRRAYAFIPQDEMFGSEVCP